VLNCAYGIYTLPPLKIEKLEPNVVVSIVGGRRPMNNAAADQEDCRRLREAWLAKTERKRCQGKRRDRPVERCGCKSHTRKD
jgi:hypothetical protein